MLRVCSSSQTIVSRWLELCQIDEARLLKDQDETPGGKIPGFVTHRHDQAVLSKVVFDSGAPTLEDATYFQPWSEGRSEPFLALRNKQAGYSWIWVALWLPPLFLRLWQRLSLAITPGVLEPKIKALLRR
jgi:hypothetical protein